MKHKETFGFYIRLPRKRLPRIYIIVMIIIGKYELKNHLRTCRDLMSKICPRDVLGFSY